MIGYNQPTPLHDAFASSHCQNFNAQPLRLFYFITFVFFLLPIQPGFFWPICGFCVWKISDFFGTYFANQANSFDPRRDSPPREITNFPGVRGVGWYLDHPSFGVGPDSGCIRNFFALPICGDSFSLDTQGLGIFFAVANVSGLCIQAL